MTELSLPSLAPFPLVSNQISPVIPGVKPAPDTVTSEPDGPIRGLRPIVDAAKAVVLEWRNPIVINIRKPTFLNVL
jgi:hypothetical protein